MVGVEPFPVFLWVTSTNKRDLWQQGKTEAWGCSTVVDSLFVRARAWVPAPEGRREGRRGGRMGRGRKRKGRISKGPEEVAIVKLGHRAGNTQGWQMLTPWAQDAAQTLM